MRKKYIIQLNDGYVADYNESEGSCEWISNPRDAHEFASGREAQFAKAKLEIPKAEVKEV
jgi:hypothetical protein